MGQEVGWDICSPVDVDLEPVDEVQLAAGPEDLHQVAQLIGRPQLWERDGGYIATPRSAWLHLHQFRGEQGWENMFLPNGQGTVEWRLGFDLTIPKGYFLMVLPTPEGVDGLEVPVGVLTASVLDRMAAQGGFSLAVRPRDSVSLVRGAAIARVLLLHQDSLQAQAVETAAAVVEDVLP